MLNVMLALAGVAAMLLLFSHGSVMDPELARYEVGSAIAIISVLVLFIFARSWQSNWFGVLALGIAVIGPWWGVVVGTLVLVIWTLSVDKPVRLPARLLGTLPVVMVGIAANLLPETVSGRDVTITVCCLIVGFAPALGISWGMTHQFKQQAAA